MFIVNGCASIKKPTSPPTSNQQAIEVIKHFPAVMPKGAARFEQTQLFFVHADHASEFAVGLLVPIPFVTDAIVDSSKNEAAEEYEKQYQSLSVYEITLQELANKKNLEQGPNGYQLYPLLFMEECVDEVYRLSLAYQVEREGWMNRYYYHLQTTIPMSDIGSPAPKLLQNISRELRDGASQLLNILKRDIAGALQANEQKVTIGSLYIVGSKIGGITSPTLLKYKHADVLEESSSDVLVRVPGDPKGKAKSGGMAYGVHLFNKDQLHTYDME